MDVASSLAPCEIDVELADTIFTVPALPAIDWLTAILSPEPGSVLPGLLSVQDQRAIYRMILRGRLEPEEVNRAWRDLMAAATGRSWWTAARLVKSGTDPEAWPQVQGRMLDAGIDLEVVSIGALCNWLFFLLMSSAKDDEERASARFELELPPPGEEQAAWDDREQMAQDFLANFAQLKQLG